MCRLVTKSGLTRAILEKENPSADRKMLAAEPHTEAHAKAHLEDHLVDGVRGA